MLTEEEKEFLKQCKKINNKINRIQSFEDITYLMNDNGTENIFIINDTYKNLFKNLQNGRGYTLEELGLEED